MSRFLKVTVWAGGFMVVAVLVSLAALMVNWGKSAARVERDTLIREKSSPDGQFVAEIHTFLTAMHGGPCGEHGGFAQVSFQLQGVK
jgi:hypothetical protein